MGHIGINQYNSGASKPVAHEPLYAYVQFGRTAIDIEVQIKKEARTRVYPIGKLSFVSVTFDGFHRFIIHNFI